MTCRLTSVLACCGRQIVPSGRINRTGEGREEYANRNVPPRALRRRTDGRRSKTEFILLLKKFVETSGRNSFGINLKLFERQRKYFGGDSNLAGAGRAYVAFQGSRLTSDWSPVTGEETMIPTVAADGRRNRLWAEGRAKRRNAGPLCARAGALLTIRIS